MKKLILLFFLFIFAVKICYAFNISPHRYELNVVRGKTYKIEFKIVNVYDYTISVKPCFYDKKLPENQKQQISSKKWIKKITPEKFVLKPKKTKKVKVKIYIPKEMAGKSAVMISFPIEKLEAEQLPVQMVVSVPVYVSLRE